MRAEAENNLVMNTNILQTSIRKQDRTSNYTSRLHITHTVRQMQIYDMIFIPINIMLMM